MSKAHPRHLKKNMPWPRNSPHQQWLGQLGPRQDQRTSAINCWAIIPIKKKPFVISLKVPVAAPLIIFDQAVEFDVPPPARILWTCDFSGMVDETADIFLPGDPLQLENARSFAMPTRQIRITMRHGTVCRNQTTQCRAWSTKTQQLTQHEQPTLSRSAEQTADKQKPLSGSTDTLRMLQSCLVKVAHGGAAHPCAISEPVAHAN